MLKKLILVTFLIGLALSINGGFEEKTFTQNNADDAQALNVALKAMQQKYASLTFESVQACFFQVVAGLRYKLVLLFQDDSGKERTFEATIFLQSWNNIEQVEEIKELSGGYGKKEEVDPTINEIQSELMVSLVNQCVTTLKQRVNKDLSKFQLANSEVLSQQTVQGVIYVFKIDLQNEAEQQASYNCEIWSRPWLNPSAEVLKVSDHKPTLQQTGSPKTYKFDQNNAEDALAINALTQYLQEQNTNASIRNLEITKATKQLVAGANYKLWIVYEVNGFRSAGVATVFVQSWQNHAQVTDFQPLYM